MGRVMVTGAAGFLGTHLCEALLQSGVAVIAVDDLSTGSIKNFKKFEMYGNLFEIILRDIRDPLPLVEVSEIWNLACPASPPKYQLDPVKTLLTSVIGVHNVLRLASENDNCKVFQASTSEIYGDPTVHPQPESYFGNVNTVGPRSCYDEGKRAAETLMNDYNKNHDVQIAIARIFNTYGPGMDRCDGRVVSNFINQALRNEPITIYGDGSQTRSFCYVKDEIAGLIALMNSSITDPVNIGNDAEFTVLELAEMVIKKTKSKSKLVFCKLPMDDPKQRKPDLTRARTELNWSPTTDLSTGLDLTIEYFGKN